MNSNGVETMDLTLAGDTFDDLRKDYDTIMQRMIKSMGDTGADEAKITVTVDVKLDTEFIPRYNKDGKQDGGRDIKKPTFKHKVSSTIQVKDEKSGVRNTEMELVWDEEQSMWVLKPVLGAEQMNINDYMAQKADQEAANVQTSEPKMIESHTPQLAGPVEETDSDVVDADFREVEADAENSTEDSEDDNYEYDEPEEEE